MMDKPYMDTTPLKAAQTCRLTSLPRELRDCIYDLVFAPEDSNDILEALPPHKALLTTCKQIHTEAKGIYKASYRAFWTDSNFVLSLRGLKTGFVALIQLDYRPLSAEQISQTAALNIKLMDFFARIQDKDLAHVRRLRIEHDEIFEERARKEGKDPAAGSSITFRAEDGLWHSSHDGKECSWFMYPAESENDIEVRHAVTQTSLGLGNVKTFKGICSNWPYPEPMGKEAIRKAKRTTGKSLQLTKGELRAVIQWLTDWCEHGVVV